MAGSPPSKGGLSAVLAAAPGREAGPTALGKKRTLSIQASPKAASTAGGSSLAAAAPPPEVGSGLSSGGLLSSALAASIIPDAAPPGIRSMRTGGALSAALRSQSQPPSVSIPEADSSGAPLSPLSSTTPLSVTPSEAVPMPRRKYPKKQQGEQTVGSYGSEEDEFDSAAMPLSVRDPNFMPPHLLLSMSLPNGAADFGRGAFRPGSVMEGRGRKLCGMDAFRVRNDILRQTGFLEPGDNPLASGSVSGGL